MCVHVCACVWACNDITQIHHTCEIINKTDEYDNKNLIFVLRCEKKNMKSDWGEK